MTKFDFFMFRDSLFALSHSLTLPSSRLTRDSSSFKLLFESIILVCQQIDKRKITERTCKYH